MAQFVTNRGLLRTLELIQADVSHMGVSTGSAPIITSVTLNDELTRKAFLDPLIDGHTLVVDGFFDESEAIGTLTGWGVLGNGATNTSNTGELFAATSANIPKTDGDSLTLSAEITLRRVTV